MRMHHVYQDVVYVRIGSPDNEPYMIHEEACERIFEFNKWCHEQKIYSVRMLAGGGGRYEGLFRKEDWKKIKQWLEANDFKYGPTSRREEEG